MPICNPCIRSNLAPDIETANDAYRTRFAGTIGEYFLDVQSRKVLGLLGERSDDNRSVLEVGGGHAQLTPALLEAGFDVCVQGSDESCFRRLRELVARYPGRLTLVSSDLERLPFAEGTFDSVIAIRLLAHVDTWENLLGELARVSRKKVIVDYPPSGSFNILYPLLFVLKRSFEKSTRPYRRFRRTVLERPLKGRGFQVTKVERQFFLPMVLHRLVNRRAWSQKIEGFAAMVGLTELYGSPAVLLAEMFIERML